jgi:hypothetical protein
MPGSSYIDIVVNIHSGLISFTKGKYPFKLPYSDDDNEFSANNIRIELGIARVFHKVLNLIKTNTDLFQKEDFELLGEMLAKILFGKVSNEQEFRNSIMREVEDTIEISNPGSNKICRIFLEFDEKSDVAMLPWEYTLYKTRSIRDTKTFYLSANLKSRFQLIRRVNNKPCIYPNAEKLLIIVMGNYGGNPEATPSIDSRIGEEKLIKSMFDCLKKQFPDSLEIKYLEPTSLDNIVTRVSDIYNEWESKYGQPPCYVLHYVGHAMLDEQIGKLVINKESTDKPDWVKDEDFASLFDELKLKKQPSLVCFQACDSAKIGNIAGNLRGVAYAFTKINIPAVIGMQNEINTLFSNAFFEKFYASILNAKDVAEAVTTGRDYLGREYQKGKPVYTNNSFGSPVLFITTEEPIRLLKSEIMEQQEEDKASKTVDLSKPEKLFVENERVKETQKESDIGIVTRLRK